MSGDIFVGHEPGEIDVRCEGCGRKATKWVSSKKTASREYICVRCLEKRLRGVSDD